MTTSNETTTSSNFLDRSAVAALNLNWEKIAWIALILLALALRLYELGARTMSHDESLHTTYSYNLYSGIGFQHDPLMHGPLLFHLTAASYFLFGPSDFSARLPVVLLGVGVVWLLWLTRRWLGRLGAFLAATMVVLSPTLLFHSRYIRHDMYAIFFIVAVAIFAFTYIDKGGNKWLYLMAGALGLSFTTKEVSFISAIILVGFLALWVLIRLAKNPWEHRSFKIPFYIMLAIGGVFLAYPMLESMKAPVGQMVTSARFGGMVVWPLLLIGLIIVAVAMFLVWRGYGGENLRDRRDVEVMLWVLTLSAPLFAAFPIKIFGGNPQSISISTDMLNSQTLQGAGIFVAMLVLFAAVGVLFSRERYLVGLGIFYGLMLVFFTTFFTNGNGIATGLVGSVGYWLSQQEVARGSQPWFYYLMLVPLYEFLPMILAFLGAGSIVISTLRRRPIDDNPTSDSPYRIRREWLWFLVWWMVATWLAYTWAGEKMPWLTTHFAVPMTLLGGWFLARQVLKVDWSRAKDSGALWLLLGIPIWVLALSAFLRLRPFQGSTLDGLSNTMSWFASLLALVGLGYVLVRKARQIGSALTWQMIFFSFIAVLALFSVRTAFMASYVNYDEPVEMLVYAHGTPDIKIVVNELDEISRRTVGEGQLAFAYDNETTWPFEWYFRDFPNKKFFGGNPSRDVLKDAPVVLVGTENEEKVKPYLGNDYYRIPYRQIWWPKETYKQLESGITLEDGTTLKGLPLLFKWLTTPEDRQALIDVILYRRYKQPLAEWDPADHFLMFVRKDIAAQVWDMGAAPVAVAEAVADPFDGKYRLEPALQIVGGSAGQGPGQLQQPRNVAIGPDGRIYVADSGNHRIVVFNPDGTYAFDWGTFGEQQGQFNEPWGIAISDDGTVYVADTWNHRIQVFDPEGKFLRSWGAFVSTEGQLGQLGVFWGPRAVAIDSKGNLLVTDTGNKRIQVFDADGGGITQFGGGGVEPGFFEEPVGVAVAPDGSIYVADTWNQRIQKFDQNYQFVQEWPVPGWDDEGIFNKPYLTVDQQGNIYVTDPTGWRVLVWNSAVEPLAALGQYGSGPTDFGFVNGIATGPDGTIWVVDADNSRVMQFAPIQ